MKWLEEILIKGLFTEEGTSWEGTHKRRCWTLWPGAGDAWSWPQRERGAVWRSWTGGGWPLQPGREQAGHKSAWPHSPLPWGSTAGAPYTGYTRPGAGRQGVLWGSSYWPASQGGLGKEAEGCCSDKHSKEGSTSLGPLAIGPPTHLS